MGREEFESTADSTHTNTERTKNRQHTIESEFLIFPLFLGGSRMEDR